MLDLALLLTGLAAIAWGTTLAINNAIVIAERRGLSDFFVGFALLAVGSDLPELVVSVDAALRNLFGGPDTSSLIVGNAIGSCFGQFGLVMGFSGLVGYHTLPRRYIWRHGSALLGGILFLALTGLDGTVSRIEGAILTGAFLVYLASLIGEERALEKTEKAPQNGIGRAWLLLFVGMVTVLASSELIVGSAVRLAEAWNVRQSLIAICIIGIGTSLPELSICVVAIRKSRRGISVGNMVGSNILDTLLPVGLAALIHPVGFEASLLRFDLPILLLLTFLVLAFFVRRRGLQRGEAILLLVFYAGYILLKLLGVQ